MDRTFMEFAITSVAPILSQQLARVEDLADALELKKRVERPEIECILGYGPSAPPPAPTPSLNPATTCIPTPASTFAPERQTATDTRAASHHPGARRLRITLLILAAALVLTYALLTLSKA
jgi:hypothetical protein